MMRHNIFIAFFILASVICLFSNFSFEGRYKPHPYDFKEVPAFGQTNIPADNPLTIEGVWLGRLLFYDTILSINGKMSCGSCHLQQLSFTDGRKVAVGVHGDTLKRNTMSLINLAWGQRFFWDGRALTLEALVKEPLSNPKEMGGITETSLIHNLKAHRYYPGLFKRAFPGEEISLITLSKAIAQFLRTIVSKTPEADPDTIRIISAREAEMYHRKEGYDKEYDPRNSPLLKENSLLGSVVRVGYMQCKSCHISDGFGGEITTVDQNDSVFKAPSFMNIMYTAPYFHDGRFKTLREVLQFYNDNMETLQLKNPKLMEHQKEIVKFNEYDLEHADELFSFFKDSTINTNPAFSNPFKQPGFTWQGIKTAIK